jgi:hypothetical protein
MNLRQLTLYFLVAVLTFVCGVSAHRVLSDPGVAEASIVSVFELREDQWHRLFEASAISGDSTFRNEIFLRTACIGPDFALKARLTQDMNGEFCQTRSVDGDTYSLWKPYYTHKELMIRHDKWLATNPEFLQEIQTPQQASRYVAKHAW